MRCSPKRADMRYGSSGFSAWSMKQQSDLLRGQQHVILNGKCADLPAHSVGDLRRESIMHTRPDARIAHVRDVVLNAIPSPRYAWRGWACHRYWPDRSTADFGFQNRGNSRCRNAVRTWIFGMHWSVYEWHPCGIAARRRVAINIAIADCSHRTPEIVSVFGVEHGNIGVGPRHMRQRK